MCYLPSMQGVFRRSGVAMALGFGAIMLLAGAAHAQDLVPRREGLGGLDSFDPKRPLGPEGLLSMQSQLGAIPLVSPRAGAQTPMVRKVQLTQVVGGVPSGAAREFICPATGCQQHVALAVNQAPESFLLDLQFVTRGTYVALSSRSAAISNVVEHHQGRVGPVFVKGSAMTTEGMLAFSVAPATSLRRLEVAQKDGKTLAQGNVYTRKREPDVVLLIKVGAPEPAK